MQNNSWISLGLGSVALFVGELFYFKIAERFNIIDRPNERSSHIQHTIRGGGIIFVFGVLFWFFQSGFQWPWFVLALMVIAIISFLDDVTSIHAGVRFLFHLVAIFLILYQLWPLAWPIYLLLIMVIVCIGTLNAFNFMDGINGITGIYALVTLLTFVCINHFLISFTDWSFLFWIIATVVIFLFFNLRKVAVCFAGDVGSVTMALILIFLLLQLILATGNFLWPLLFLVYGTDSIVTIIYRLRRKENIFKAHRTHLYQYLCNEMKLPHIVVSVGYGITQALVNLVVFVCLPNSHYTAIIVMSAGFVIIYFFLRREVINRIKL